MSATPQQIIPPLYFKTICQNPSCRTPLGGFHVPQVGATIIYACQRCQHASVYKVEQFGIVPFLLDRHGKEVKPPSPAVRK